MPNIARIVVEDVVLAGTALKAGDPILLPACLQSLDDDTFEDPFTVDFGRENARLHGAFSFGRHRCPGAMLAAAEIHVFLEEWLRRIPQLTVAKERTS